MCLGITQAPAPEVLLTVDSGLVGLGGPWDIAFLTN